MEVGGRGGTLVARLGEALKAAIADGTYPPGSKLPSEAELCREHRVSRTVVREAVAALRADGLVEARQGAGVFVLRPEEAAATPFRGIDMDRVSSMIELLELRTAVEAEAAALAALRRSPAQEERIIEGHREVQALAQAGKSTADADYRLHLAIAEATNNPRFRDFLAMMGPGVILRRALGADGSEPVSEGYLEALDEEHGRIVSAIVAGDEAAAREAMRAHLQGSQSRYRALLRKAIRR